METNQQKCHFFAVSLHFCLPFGFVFIRLRSWEIPGFCVSKSRGLRTDHKRVKKIEMQCCSVTQTRLECLQLTRTIFLLFWVYTVHKTVIGLRRTTKIMYHTKFCRISKVCPGLLFYSRLFTTLWFLVDDRESPAFI